MTVTDSAGAPATDTENFTWTVNAAPVGVTPIADIQGTGRPRRWPARSCTTQGVVTAAYPTGGFNGFYIQTPGADTAPTRRTRSSSTAAGGFDDVPGHR